VAREKINEYGAFGDDAKVVEDGAEGKDFPAKWNPVDVQSALICFGVCSRDGGTDLVEFEVGVAEPDVDSIVGMAAADFLI